MLTITAAAVAPTSKVVANWGSTGATRPKPSAIRKAATSITLMSRGSRGPPGRRRPGQGLDPLAEREVLLMVLLSVPERGPGRKCPRET